MSYQKYQVSYAQAITPADNTALNLPGEGKNPGVVLYVGTGGDIRVKTVRGSVVTLKNINDGQFIPVQVIEVFSTGTTADDIVALW